MYYIRSDVAQPESMSTKLPHKPLGFQEVEPIPRKDDNVPFTSDDKEEVGMCDNHSYIIYYLKSMI